MTTSRLFPAAGVAALAFSVALAHAQTATPVSSRTSVTEEEPLALSPFEVSAARDTSYRVNNALSANRIAAPILDTPQSIFVLTEEFLKDMEIVDLQEAMAYVPGVSMGVQGAAGDNEINVRGMAMIGSLLDGMPDKNLNVRPDSAIVERVEVLKGASSSLYGSSSPAGVMNSITKKPRAKAAYNFSTTVGSYDFMRGQIDLTGPVNSSKTLLYRLVAASEGSDSFRDFVNSDRWTVYPALTYIIKAGTQITTSFEYLHSREVTDPGIPIIGTEPLPSLPRERYLGAPEREYDIYKRVWRAFFEHRFNANWSGRLGYVHADVDADKPNGQVTGRVNVNNRTIARQFGQQVIFSWNDVAQLDVLGEFRTGPFTHRSLIGLDFRRDSQDLTNYIRAVTPALNVDRPIYTPGTVGAASVTVDNTADSYSYGAFWQNQASFFERRVQLVTGLRFDALKQVSTSLTQIAPLTFRPPDVVTPRLALLYHPWKNTTVYTAYGEAFRPDTSGRPIFGTDKRLEPVTGLLYEAGVKLEFMEGKVFFDFDVYQVTNENIVESDGAHPGFVIQSGAQESNGGSFSFNVDPLPGLTMFGGYSYIDARNTETLNPLLVGTQLPNAPRHSGTLFVKYRVRSGPLAKLGLGVGVRRVGTTHGPSNTTLEFPAYTVINAQMDYAWRNYTFNVAVNNVMDELYWVRPSAFNGNRAGQPLSYRASVRVRF
ncbi:MAG: TonB-dependent siderophore receptor [Verrucomicrobiota bacterium]